MPTLLPPDDHHGLIYQLVLPGRLLPFVVRGRVGVDPDGRVVVDAAVVEHRRLRDDVDGRSVTALPVLRRRPIDPSRGPGGLVLQRGGAAADGENLNHLERVGLINLELLQFASGLLDFTERHFNRKSLS